MRHSSRMSCRPVANEPKRRTPRAGDRVSPEDPSADVDSTAQLIERVRAGDKQALNHLVTRHLKPLRRWASGRLPKWARDLADTDDLVQDTLVRTIERIPAFEPRRVGGLQAYLRQAVLNRIRNELRRKLRQPLTTELGDIQADSADSPLELAIGTEAVERYEAALKRLKEDDQEAIVASVELGYSYDELAAALDKPTPDAARKATRRAILRLAQEMRRGAR
jgi:RNA polymerase sigma factor (sigma-70 family)